MYRARDVSLLSMPEFKLKFVCDFERAWWNALRDLPNDKCTYLQKVSRNIASIYNIPFKTYTLRCSFDRDDIILYVSLSHTGDSCFAFYILAYKSNKWMGWRYVIIKL